MQEYIDTFPDSKETIYYQMAYYDLKNLAAKITGPVFASVGSQDPICPMTDFCQLSSNLNPKTINCVFKQRAWRR